MLNKKKLNFSRKDNFLLKKLSANSSNTAYTIGLDGNVINGEPDIMWQTICFIKDTQEFWVGGLLYSKPSKISDLENDMDFISSNDVSNAYTIITLEDTTISMSITSEGENAITNNTIFKCNNPINSITLTPIEALPYEVVIMFTTSSSASNALSIPAGIMVVGEIDIEANKNYIASILNNYIIVKEANIN